MSAVRWVSFMILLASSAWAFTGERSWFLAAVMTVSLLVTLFSFGGAVIFTRDYWVGDPEVNAELAEMDVEIAAREQRMRDRRDRIWMDV